MNWRRAILDPEPVLMGWFHALRERRRCPNSPNGHHLWVGLHTTTSIPMFDPRQCEYCGKSG